MMKQRSLHVLVLLVWCASQATAFSPLSRRPRTTTARARVASPSLAAALHPSSASSSTPFVLWDDQATTTTTTTTTTVPGIDDSLSYLLQTASNAYVQFAKENPFLNNMAIACTKTAAADILAQTVIGGTPLMDLDLQRTLLFFMFGGAYCGAFQWLYQVQIFKRLFDVDKFTEQCWADKLRDTEGLQALAAQTALDIAVATAVYLPTFYIFKASVFEGTFDPTVWFSVGWDDYLTNFMKDEFDLVRVWLPADLVCFSVAMYLRLPVRHIVSFMWTAYLSFARGGQ